MYTFSFLQRNSEEKSTFSLSDFFFVEKAVVYDTHINSLIKTVKDDHMLCHICSIFQKEKSIPIRTESLCSAKEKWYFSEYSIKHMNIQTEQDIKKIISSHYRKIINFSTENLDIFECVNNYLLYELIFLLHVKQQEKLFLIEEFKKDINYLHFNLC